MSEEHVVECPFCGHQHLESQVESWPYGRGWWYRCRYCGASWMRRPEPESGYLEASDGGA